MPQPTAPQFTLKGRLFFRPNGSDTEHDLGEIELGPVQPIVNAYAKRQTFATGGVVGDPINIRTERRGEHTVVPQDEVRRVAGIVLPTGPTPPSGISPSPINGPINGSIATAVRGLTVDMYNGKA